MKQIILLFLLLGFLRLQAQETVSTTGNTNTNGKVSLSWTIGEIIISTVNNSSNIITQGVQQSNLTVTSINNFFPQDYEITAYPNPVKDFITLKISCKKILNKNLKYQLINIKGHLINLNSIKNNEVLIPMSGYNSGEYILTILQDDNNIKQFKIIKL